MNGSQGITPTVELATTNGGNGFAYPYPMYYGNSNNGGFGNGDGWWVLILIALLGGFGNNGFGGGFGGNNNDFAWLSNGQKDIMTNTNNGFDTLHLSNQIEGIRDGIGNIATSMCSNTADIVSAVNNGFSNAEISANARQIADMNQNFNNQLSLLNNFNTLNTSFLNCCCENKLGIADLKATVISENCQDREALSNGIRDIISSNTANTQAILDKLCSQELEAYRRENNNLRSELQMADLKASQLAQTSALREGQNMAVDNLYRRLADCPVGTTPVYGNQPIFTCPNNNWNNGCGCNGNVNFI